MRGMRGLGATTIAICAIAVACSSSTTSNKAQGQEDGPCYPNNTCNQGLSCLSNVCVNALADGAASGSTSGSSSGSGNASSGADGGGGSGSSGSSGASSSGARSSSGSGSGLGGSSGSSSGLSTTGPSDGTTGKLCAMDTDCKGPGGPGVNVCSIAGYFSGGPLNPTPVCLSPVACDLGTGINVTYCDGASPTDPTSPGICLPAVGTSGTNGQCFPKCNIPPDGSAATGCQGKNRCNLFATGTSTSGNPVAIGYCLGGCAANSDCPSGSTCQKDQGLCVTTQQTATKQLGQVCTSNDLTSTTYGCNCYFRPMTSLGYCSQFCITGPSSPAPCPSGYTCDPQLPSQVMGLSDASVHAFTQVNPGLAGFCLQPCNAATAGDAGNGDAQAASTCPVSAACDSQFAAGPDCVP